MYIYAIKNLVTNQAYVGQTRNVVQRKAGHMYSARKGDKRKLYCAMREYGFENFAFETLEECHDDHASEREQFWVNQLRAFSEGYNLTHGGGYHVGNKGRKFTKEHKDRISAALKGRKTSRPVKEKLSTALQGRKRGPRSDEVKRKISESLSGRTFSEETRQKISDSLTGRSLPEETRHKIGEAGRGRRHTPETIDKMKAHVFSDQHRQKLREAALLREARKRQEKST